MKFSPRPYQSIIVDRILKQRRTNIWAGMGLGKTVSTLTALDVLDLRGEDPFPALVIAPKRVALSTWPAEARKWGHLRHLRINPMLGDAGYRISMARSEGHVYTINYDNLPWLVEYWGAHWPYRTVVSDESTRLKGFRLRQGGKRAQALARVAHSKVDRWINLTGTPSPNGLKDLWGQMWFIDQGKRLGRTFSAFQERWFQKSFDGFSFAPLPFAEREIMGLISDVCLSLRAEDWFGVEDPIMNTVWVDLPVKAMRQYRDMEREMFAEIEGHPIEVFNAAARTMKCLQLANGAAYIDEKASKWSAVHDAKIEALGSIVEEAAGEPILVAYHFQSDLHRLLKAFPQAKHLDADPRTEADWNAGKIPILCAHPASAGHGLNLQDGGRTVVFFGHWWDLEQYAQIIERVGPVRQMQAGHPRSVFVHHIVARDTVDEIVMDRREGKREVQDLLMEYMRARR